MVERPPALYDQLTGLVNRDLFMDRLAHAKERAERQDRLLALILAEINGFDTLPEEEHDILLRAAAQRLRSCVRKVDTLARPDEARFAVIVEGVRARDQVTELANKVVGQLDQPFIVNDERRSMTASVGISIYPWDTTEVDRLVWNAETAMLKAHNAGGNSYRLFDEGHLPE